MWLECDNSVASRETEAATRKAQMPQNPARAYRWALVFALLTSFASAQMEPGKRVSLGGYSLQIYCTGHGAPTTVVENGLGDFIFDWM